MSITKTKTEPRKSFLVKAGLHKQVKDYTDAHGLKLNIFVESTLSKAVGNGARK